MSNASRKARGAATQRLVAEHFAANGWPYATDAGAGRNGVDVLGTPGLAIEVKARRELRPAEWVRQAEASDGLPLVVFRPDGMGEATLPEWPILMRLRDLISLLHKAGFGERS